MKKYITPFSTISERDLAIIAAVQVFLFCIILQMNKSDILPSPLLVLENFFKLLASEEFLMNLFSSLTLIVKGMGIAIIVACLLSYLSLIPAFKYLIKILASFRYLTLTGLTFIFTLYSKDTDSLRTNLLLFSVIPFFLIAMLDVIAKTDKASIELCFTLRMGPFRTLWEVIVVGKKHEVVEVLKNNFAICWMMITAVEGVAFNLGGIGTMLIKSNKYANMNGVLPVILAVLFIGLGADLLLGTLKNILFPYSKMSKI